MTPPIFILSLEPLETLTLEALEGTRAGFKGLGFGVKSSLGFSLGPRNLGFGAV